MTVVSRPKLGRWLKPPQGEPGTAARFIKDTQALGFYIVARQKRCLGYLTRVDGSRAYRVALFGFEFAKTSREETTSPRLWAAKQLVADAVALERLPRNSETLTSNE